MEEDLLSITGGPLKPHEYVLIKSYQNAGDVRYIQNHSAKTRGIGEVVMTLGDTQFATFQRMVKGWNLTKTISIGDEKKEVPIPFDASRLEQCIEALPGKIYTYILAEMNKRYGVEEDGESDQNFQNAVIDSSEVGLNTERVLHLRP